VLDGLQKHAHLVNIDFVDDLFKQLYTLVDEHVSVRACVRTNLTNHCYCSWCLSAIHYAVLPRPCI
jgi:hypothetical protein